MIVALLILIVLILLFGAAAVKGWIGSIAATVASGVALILIFTVVIVWVGKDNVDLLVGIIIGVLLILGVWAKLADQPTEPINRPAERSISETRQARIEKEHDMIFRNPTYLTKEEKKSRRNEYKRDHP